MKILEEPINLTGDSTIKIKWGEIPRFPFPLHVHSYCEILYVPEFHGTKFVGDCIESFERHELILMAGNLPHFWRRDETSRPGEPERKFRRMVVHFPDDFLGQALNVYPEFASIRSLMEKASRGISFLEPDSSRIGRQLLKLNTLDGFRQIIQFLKILHKMAQVDNYRLLASEAYNAGTENRADDRLHKVTHFLAYNYGQRISLNEVAELAGMHPTAFSRYFKEKTGKQFTVYLNELRIGFACKLLVNGKLQISEISFETGYNNLSNFNRTFKAVTGLTPTDYQKKYLQTAIFPKN